MNKVLYAFFLLAMIACQKKGAETETVEEEDKVVRTLACSTTALETQMNATLANVSTDTDFSLVVERADGRIYSFNRESSTPLTVYESASTSKLVTAVIILRLVDQGVLNLTDKPQTYISSWPIPASDSLYPMNLAQLLSFTSGLETEPLCLNSGTFDFENCVTSIANTNAGNNITPGSVFYYSSNHMQVAGLMAIKAKHVASWQNIFNSFKLETGLFPSGTYDLPSLTNPRLAGGMHWKGMEYLAFLRALKNGVLLSNSMQSQLLLDQIATASIGNSPVKNAIDEDWHYGFGIWHECQSPTFNCNAAVRVSSPGTYGAYPFWDRQKNYIGIVARQGALGTYKNGVALEKLIRSSLGDWSSCTF